MSRFLAVLICLGVAFPLVAQAPQGKKYAILVGVNEYDSAQFAPLKWAVNDAVQLGALLKTQGFEVELLHSGGSVAPTVANINSRLGALLDKCKRHDIVFVALAGHGIQLEKEKPTDADDAFFCPQDARIAAGKRGTLLSLRHLYQQLDESGAGVKLLVVDACRDLGKVPRGAKRSLDSASYVVPPKGVAALFSCSAGESAYELQSLKHGLFFHTLLEGLRGKAASDGQVTWDNLQAYVRTRVPQDVVKFTGDPQARQTPSLCSSELAGQPPVLAVTAKLNLPRPKTTPSKYLDLDLGGGVGIQLVRIEPGKFVMGTHPSEERYPDEEPQHEVEITKPFYMGVHEVTRGQFRAFVAASGYRTDAQSDGKGAGYFNEATRKFNTGGKEYNWRNTGFHQTDDHPVVNVTWNDAVAFCGWLSRTSKKQVVLPTEAQWEYACRAGTKTRFHGGSADFDIKPLGNIADLNLKGNWVYSDYPEKVYVEQLSAWFNLVTWYDGFTFTAPVGQYQANPWGLYDMHGNVWEWCQDWHAVDYYGKSPKQDPRGPGSGKHRVARSGSFSNTPLGCRAAMRSPTDPDSRFVNQGFRVVVLVP